MGQLISQICDKMMTLGLVWVISGSGSLQQIPLFLAAGALPHLLLSKWSGRWVSQFSPLKTVIWTDLIRGVLFLIVFAIWLWAPPGRPAVLPILFVMTLFANTASALFNPAIMSLPIRLAMGLAPKSGDTSKIIGQLTAMVDACFSGSNILGPAIVALIFPWVGLTGLFLLNGLSYLWAAFLESAIELPSAETEPGATTPDEAPAKNPAKGDPLIRFMLSLFFLMNLVLTPLFVFLPLFARNQYQGSIHTLAFLEIALGAGSVLGSLTLTFSSGTLKTGVRTILGCLAISASYLFFSLNHVAALGAAALFLLGLCLSLVNISLLSLFQMRPDPGQVPRIMSYVNLISVGALPFSMLLLGGVIEKVNLQTLALTCSITFLGLTLISALHSDFRKA